MQKEITGKKILETPRLLLNEFTEDDASFIVELLNSPDWLQYIGDRNVRTTEDASRFINEKYIDSYKKNGFGLYAVVLKENNITIGMCGLIKRDSLEDIDIGFAFLPEYISKGYGFESAVEVLKYGKEILNLKRIVAITIKSNNKSVNLLKKIGMKFEKSFFMEGDSEELLLFTTQ
jgi:RimJ/RimL family protein N-acetyltransferase